MTNTQNNFLNGWRELPDELKLQVLGYAFPSGLYLSADTFRGEHEKEGFVSLREHILPMLACSEIASLGIEVIYKQNVLDFAVLAHNRQPFLLPPKNLRKHVRAWVAAMRIEELERPPFDTLARNNAGFPPLNNVQLTIWCTESQASAQTDTPLRDRVVAVPAFHFNTREMEVHYKPLDEGRFVFDAFDDVMEEKFMIAGKLQGMKKSCERAILSDAEGLPTSRIVSKWPVVLEKAAYARQVKITVWR